MDTDLGVDCFTAMRWGCTVAVWVVASVLVTRSGVWAQGDGPARARSLFLEGQKAAEAGDYPTACGRFAESERLEPAAGTVFNLADCEEHVGHFAAAWTSYRKGLDRLTKKDDARRRPVEQRLAALDKQIARLTIRVGPNAPTGTAVQQDGADVDAANLGIPIATEPGAHVVIATAPGYRSRRYEVSLKAGKAAELEVEPEQSPAVTGASTSVDVLSGKGVAAHAAPAVPPEAAATGAESSAGSSGGGGRYVGIVVGSIGVAGIVLGGVTRGLAFGKSGAIDAHCTSDGACDAAGMDAVSSARTLQTVSTISLIAGVAGVGAGAYLLFSSPGRSATQARVGPMLWRGGAGLRLEQEF